MLNSINGKENKNNSGLMLMIYKVKLTNSKEIQTKRYKY